MYIESLRHGFTGLLRFSGRDRPGRFWPFAGTVIGLGLGAYMAALVPVFMGMMGRIQRIAVTHPEDVVIEQGPGYYSARVQGNHPEVMPDFGALTVLTAAVALFIAVFLAAAITRRLHDSNWRGWPALVPLGLLGVGLARMRTTFASFAAPGAVPDMQMFAVLMLVNSAYLLSLCGLIILLVREGSPGPNRFGDRRA